MPDEEKKIIVDSDWKQEARRDKERLAQETADAEPLPAANFAEIVNLIVIQAMVGLGLVGSPDGRRVPPNLELAKHFIDLLQVLEDKTKGNLSAQEKALLDQVIYETRMTFVQLATGGGAGAPPPSGLDPAAGGA